jgi:1-phosphatidylinositol-4-phosphate 5-kinase
MRPAHEVPFFEADQGGLSNFDETKIYYFGVIDILTEYNTKKKLEHFFKSLKYGTSTISCVPSQ